MAIAAGTVWEVRTTGSDNNGGGFVSGLGGTDFSQQNAAQVNIDNATITTSINGTTVTFTGGTYTPTAADVGNIVQFLSGTNVIVADATHNGFYEITSQTSSTWVLDRTPLSSGTTTNATAKMGGALASPGAAGNANNLSGNGIGGIVFIKNGTYSMTNNANIAGGRYAHTALSTDVSPTQLIGYSTTRTVSNTDTGPTLQPSAGSMICVDNNGGNAFYVYNILFNANAQTNCTAIRFNNFAGNMAERCQATGAFATAFGNLFSVGNFVNCYATGAGNGFSLTDKGSSCRHCVATACTTAGFNDNGGTGARYFQCISFANTGYGFLTTAADSHYNQCTSYNNSGANGHGFMGSDRSEYTNCVATNNAKFGFATNQSAGSVLCRLYNCAGFSNTSGNVDTSFGYNVGFVTLTAGPFNNPGGGDFSLNNTTGGGAALRGAGFVSAFPGISTNNFFDIGAVQHLIIIIAALLIIPAAQAQDPQFFGPGYSKSSYGIIGAQAPVVNNPYMSAVIGVQSTPLPFPDPGRAWSYVGVKPVPIQEPIAAVIAFQVTPNPFPAEGTAYSSRGGVTSTPVAPAFPYIPPVSAQQAYPVPFPDSGYTQSKVGITPVPIVKPGFVVVASQEVPRPFPESGSAYSKVGQVVAVTNNQQLYTKPVIAGMELPPSIYPFAGSTSSQFGVFPGPIDITTFTPQLGEYICEPTLLCPIDLIFTLLLKVSPLPGGTWTGIKWQCLGEPTHNGFLPINPNVIPSQVKGQVQTGNLTLSPTVTNILVNSNPPGTVNEHVDPSSDSLDTLHTKDGLTPIDPSFEQTQVTPISGSW